MSVGGSPYLIMATYLTQMCSTYDFKVVEFPNGSVEIRVYDEPIAALNEKEKERRQLKRSKTIECRLENTACPNELLYVPFEDKEVEVFNIDEKASYEFLEEMRKRKNARDSYRRTVNKIHDLARCEVWTMFYTLTFSPNYVDRQDFGACMKKARNWFHNVKKRKSPNMKYLLVPELHEDKCSWHIHGLVCGDDGVDYIDSGKKDKRGKTIYNIGSYKWGWTTAVRIGNTADDNCRLVSSYVLKYITKDLCERSLGQRRYFRSNNLQEPKVSTYLSSQVFDEGYVSNVDNLEKILASLGCDEITRIKKVSSEYCSVTYINAD